MSYLRRTKAACGRYVPKPNERDDNPNYEDDTSIPLQDQIDNLRAKISLKEKYNKALREEVSETNQGAVTMIADLSKLNKQLREDLQSEKHAEVFAVKKALRSYRLFQLAVTDKDADSVVIWLDDKIFDASKTLNEGMFLLRKMQNKLQDAESAVRYLEKCPVPGSEPWERKVEEVRNALSCAIENGKANRDASLILSKKYREILVYLRGEKGKWPHLMASMEKTLIQLRSELSNLELMLEDAIRFNEEAREKLQLTEEEASANRKQRRSQMNKMKKSVEKALQANTIKYAQAAPTDRGDGTRKVAPAIDRSKSAVAVNSSGLAKSYQDIKQKQAQVQEFETRANRLVQVMCVRDLRFCPERLLTVRKVNEMLSQELALKGEAKELLLRHKYRMELILQYFRYSGSQAIDDFNEEIAEREKILGEADYEAEKKRRDTSTIGEILSSLRLGMVSIEELFNQGKKRPQRTKNDTPEMLGPMKKIVTKVSDLVEAVNSLKGEFPEDSKPQRSYIQYVKFNIPARFTRVGAQDEMDADEESDQEPADDVSSKILTREELRAKSEKIRSQGMLRRGVRE